MLRVVDLVSEQQRVVSDTGELYDPVWSPDGRRVAAVRSQPAGIVVSDLTSGSRRLIATKKAPVNLVALHWSPDGRFIAYNDVHAGISLVDLQTSAVRQITPKSSHGPWPRWRSDSRAIMYGVQDPMFTTDTMRKVTIHEVTIDGQDRVLRSIVTPCNIGGTFFDCGKIVDDSLMSTWFNGDYSVVNFRSGGRARVVYTRDGYQTPQAPPVPNFSSNGRWMTVRRRLPSDESWSIEVMHPDGSAHRSVPVHFQVAQGGLNPWISDDGTELIVASGGCVRMPKYFCRDSLTFYRVGVETGKATLVASFPSKTNPFLNAMISNDGRSLAILDDIETRVDFYELDFSQLLKIAER